MFSQKKETFVKSAPEIRLEFQTYVFAVLFGVLFGLAKRLRRAAFEYLDRIVLDSKVRLLSVFRHGIRTPFSG